MAQVAASQKRYEYEIEHMQRINASYELHMAEFLTPISPVKQLPLAKNSIKKGLATQVMSTSSNIKDILIPLTTNHYRSHILSASL